VFLHTYTIKTDKVLGLILPLFSVMFLCPRILWHVVYISFAVLQLFFFVRLSNMSGDKGKKLIVFNFCTCLSIRLVKCCEGGSHSSEDCHILSVMYFPIICGFSGVAYLKILVPEFLIFKECIVGKHIV